jgi:hypothetical protein
MCNLLGSAEADGAKASKRYGSDLRFGRALTLIGKERNPSTKTGLS